MNFQERLDKARRQQKAMRLASERFNQLSLAPFNVRLLRLAYDPKNTLRLPQKWGKSAKP